MESVLDLTALKIFMRIMLTFAFTGSLFIMVDVEAYKKLNRILSKEYGLTKRLIPTLESAKSSLDDFIVKNRKFFGSLFLLISFVLLTLY
jgi:hypothetical protein